MNSQGFLEFYVREIARSLPNDHSDNYDHTRFGRERPAADYSPKGLARTLLRRLRLQRNDTSRWLLEAALDFVSPWLGKLEWLHARLADEESRVLLVQILAFRALGHRKVRLPLNTPEFWSGLDRVERLATPGDRISAEFLGWELQHFDLRSVGSNVQLYSIAMAAYVQFVIRQYQCRCNGRDIGATSDDIVIDGGACWGDTALAFSDVVGNRGRVFSFEFVVKNLAILRKNLALNPSLAPRIQVVERALWNRSGEIISFAENGPGTSLAGSSAPSGEDRVQTLSIDDLVAQQALSRLDLIKLDIEGAELAALRGAERSLRRFRPTVVAAVYHRLEDFHSLAAFLDSLGLGYKFCLRHFTIHAEETMLFAWVENR